MVNFDELQKRVEAAGGTVEFTPLDSFQFLMLRLPGFDRLIWVAATEEGIRFCIAALDGLEAKVKARRCAESFERSAEKTSFFKRIPAYKACANHLRYEFGIEEVTK